MEKQINEGLLGKLKRIYDKASGNQKDRLIKKTSGSIDDRQKQILGRKYSIKNWKTDGPKLMDDKRYNSLVRRENGLKWGGKNLPLKIGRYPKNQYLTGGKMTFREFLEEGVLRALGMGAAATAAGAVTGALSGLGPAPGAVIAGLGYLAMDAKEDLENDSSIKDRSKKLRKINKRRNQLAMAAIGESTGANKNEYLGIIGTYLASKIKN